MTKALLCAVGLAFAATALAQQYRWVDKDGKVGYGDTPPPGVQAAPLKPPAGPSAPAAAPNKDAAKDLSPEAAFRKRQQERQEGEQKAAKERADAEAKRVNCEQSQGALPPLLCLAAMAKQSAHIIELARLSPNQPTWPPRARRASFGSTASGR